MIIIANDESTFPKAKKNISSPPSTNNSLTPSPSEPLPMPTPTASSGTTLKQRTKMENMLNFSSSLDDDNNSSSIIQRLSERDHAPGIRRPGCPCCDPEDISGMLDSMMNMM